MSKDTYFQTIQQFKQILTLSGIKFIRFTFKEQSKLKFLFKFSGYSLYFMIENGREIFSSIHCRILTWLYLGKKIIKITVYKKLQNKNKLKSLWKKFKLDLFHYTE